MSGNVTKSRSNVKDNLVLDPSPPFHERNLAYIDASFMPDLLVLQAEGEIRSIIPVHMVEVTFKDGSSVLQSAKTSQYNLKSNGNI